MKLSEEHLTASLSQSQYFLASIIFIVACLHIIVLMIVLNTSSVVSKDISLPTMLGVLIQKPSSEEIKVAENTAPVEIKTVKPIPVKSRPKKIVTPVKKIPSSEKAISLPEPLVEQSVVSDVEDEPEHVDIPAQVEHAPVVVPRSDASHLNNRAPVYPRASLRRHEEGKVVLELLVRADGTVGEVRVKESSGYPRLDKAALKAVRRWRYIPARQGGEVIDFWYQQPLQFSLRK